MRAIALPAAFSLLFIFQSQTHAAPNKYEACNNPGAPLQIQNNGKVEVDRASASSVAGNEKMDQAKRALDGGNEESWTIYRKDGKPSSLVYSRGNFRGKSYKQNIFSETRDGNCMIDKQIMWADVTSSGSDVEPFVVHDNELCMKFDAINKAASGLDVAKCEDHFGKIAAAIKEQEASYANIDVMTAFGSRKFPLRLGSLPPGETRPVQVEAKKIEGVIAALSDCRRPFDLRIQQPTLRIEGRGAVGTEKPQVPLLRDRLRGGGAVDGGGRKPGP